MKNSMKGHMGKMGGKGVLHEGLMDRSPKADDASTKLKGGSVDEGAIRSMTAPTPRTLGPRTA